MNIKSLILIMVIIIILVALKGLFPAIGIGCALCYLIGKYEKKD